jgi:type II secretory pathway component PulJ
MAGQTLLERTVVLTLFALVLAGCVQLVRRALESRDVHAPGA